MKKIFFLLFAFTVNVSIAQDTTRLSLLFFGDIMQHDSQISDAYDPETKSYNYDKCFEHMRPSIQSADIAIGNLELTLAGPPYKGYPQFSAPEQILTGLQRMGADVLVTANNHCVDTGKKGLERTIKMLDSLKIPHTGTFANADEKVLNHPLMLKRNGFSIALLNYTFSTNGLPVSSPNIVNMVDTAAITRDLAKTKSLKPDVIAVFFHWGNEYESLPSAWQKVIGEHTLAHGAQLVIGAHPHVIQPMEWRKNTNQLIVYSLGNFVSGQRKRYTDGGAMVRVEFVKVQQEKNAVTKIDKANYMLQWVYRDAGKNYVVVPVAEFGKDVSRIIRETEAAQSFTTFVDDSRELLTKHNVAISEDTNSYSSGSQYSVRFFTETKSGEKFKTPVPYEVFTVVDNGAVHYQSGMFADKAQAEKYRQKLMKQFGYDGAIVVEIDR